MSKESEFHTKIMGILNITPDSFYDGGLYLDVDKAVEMGIQLVEDGADILDIGGESTRPGSKIVTIEEEIERIAEVVEKLSQEIDVPISIDTRKSEVAEAGLKVGATYINDVSGLIFDNQMANVVAKYDAGIFLMHSLNTPEFMQENIRYENLIDDICSFLVEASEKAIQSGVDKDKIIIDPGIGFGKTVENNYSIIKNISKFKELGFPVLIGLSRKSLIGKLVSEKTDRLPATLALNAVSMNNGADMIRVHDVKEHALILSSMEMLRRVE